MNNDNGNNIRLNELFKLVNTQFQENNNSSSSLFTDNNDKVFNNNDLYNATVTVNNDNVAISNNTTANINSNTSTNSLNNYYNQNNNVAINSMNTNLNNINQNKFQQIENITASSPTQVIPTSIVSNNLVDNNTQFDNQHSKERALEIKNKSTSDVPIVYDEGIDTDDSAKKGILSLLLNKKFLMIVSILILFLVCIVVAKAFYFRSKVDSYEEFFTEVTSREEEYAKAMAGVEIDNVTLKKVAASELISCINSKVDIDDLPSNVTDVIDEITNYYKQSNNYFAFKYVDIYTGFNVSFNENQGIFAASSIKAAKDIYLWEMASLGKINLDDKLTYTSRYYNTGSGLLKNRSFNTSYTIRELLKLSTIDSDNAAHNMLMDNYGRQNMLNFWKDKGTNTIFTANNNWGMTSAHDAAIYMRELYRFYLNDDTYGEDAMNNFLKSYPKFIRNTDGYNIASKSGWSGSSLHDIAIVFADNPYIVVALSNLGDKSYTSYFNNASDLAYKLHKEYWKYKIDKCNEIKQY